jgi:DNA replication protein DnaC
MEVDLKHIQEVIDVKRNNSPSYEPRKVAEIAIPDARPPRASYRIDGEGEDNRAYDWQELVKARGLRYEGCRLSSFDSPSQKQKEVVERLTSFADLIVDRTKDGSGIILFGPKGTGKDHLMMAMTRAAIAKFMKVHWVNGADMRGDVRDSTRKDDLESDYAGRLIRKQILWISDPLPVSGALTEAQQDRLFRILDGRYSNLRPTWVTVNVSSREELEQRIGPQNADRLRDGSLALFCDWPSHRETLK